jgi:hypothetical protein
MLDPLVPNLSCTRRLSNEFNGIMAFRLACPGLIRRDKGQGPKKPNENNACSLSPLVPLKGVAGAVQAAPPFSRLPLVQVRKEIERGQRTNNLFRAPVGLTALLRASNRYLTIASKFHG